MLRLIRWLLLGTLVASLLAIAVAFRIHGHTVAEVGCKLAKNATCEHWAERCAAAVRRTLELFDYPEHPRPSHGEKQSPAHELAAHRESAPPAQTNPSAKSGGPIVTTPADGPPLDQHSPQERRDLDHILTSRGSR